MAQTIIEGMTSTELDAVLASIAAVNPSRWPKAARDDFTDAAAKLARAAKRLQDDEPIRIDRRCVWCLDPMPVPDRWQGGGRSKLFCSAECRHAHYRHRHHDGSADREQWLREHRPGLDTETQ